MGFVAKSIFSLLAFLLLSFQASFERELSEIKAEDDDAMNKLLESLDERDKTITSLKNQVRVLSLFLRFHVIHY